ncbi:hypothetical protein [Psychrobacter aestuarii]|uniref:C-type lysozyme inhibitor domain-containing protein n=1 Tax=Psychrobacter aestuarii TaxID=556327 RepID=A0ABP3F7J1_9GAMM|nr:hypothetical protein [Psychrobacter aestuarii]
MTLSKTLTLIPAIALLSACATTMPKAPVSKGASQTPSAAYDRMASPRYQCNDDAVITAKQSINKQQVMINATVPTIGWKEQLIIMNGSVQGDSASYINDAHDDIIYAWHMKPGAGLLAMKWTNGKTYHVTCKRV